MASNSIPKSYDPLVSLAEDAADGAHQYGVAVKLAQNTETKIRVDLVALIGDSEAVPPLPGAQPLYLAAKAAKTAAASTQRTAESNARALAGKAIMVLKEILKSPWNSAWAAAGFTGGSLAIPDDPLPLLGELRAYFTAHPGDEVAPVLEVTAAACTAKATALSDARSAVNDATVKLGLAKQARDGAQRELYERMVGLRSELDQLLEDDDPRWYAFGFDRPADGQQPGPVNHLVLTAGGPGIVLVHWDDARRADRYRVQRQVAGVDAAPVLVTGTLYENEVTLQGLPSGQEVKVMVWPVNGAGDGPVAVSALFRVP